MILIDYSFDSLALIALNFYEGLLQKCFEGLQNESTDDETAAEYHGLALYLCDNFIGSGERRGSSNKHSKDKGVQVDNGNFQEEIGLSSITSPSSAWIWVFLKK